MNRSKANRRIIVAVSVGAALVLVGLVGQLGPGRWVFAHTLLPVARGMSAFGSATGETLSNIGHVRDLARENVSLELENANLRQRLADDAETKSDNVLLRKQLGLDVAGGPQQIAAEVLAFQPDSYRQFVTISKGRNAGVKAGLAVVSDGVLVGTVSDVQATTARVMLVTDPEFKLAAKDQDSTASGIVQGQLGSGLLMNKIGQTDTVKPGDTVTTSGLGGLVPPGLYIGSVESVDTRANVVFQSAQVATTLKATRLRFVYVVVGQ